MADVRVMKNERGDRCGTCDGTHEHFHAFDDEGELSCASDGTYTPRNQARDTRTLSLFGDDK